MKTEDCSKRFMIASPGSGAGKTLFACALMNTLQKKFSVAAFKCGPDFIDPLFHKKLLGLPSVNLDGYFDAEKDLRRVLTEESLGKEISVIEGAMGFFDGIGGTSFKASSYDVALATKTPVFLVLDAHGASRSLCATINGFIKYSRHNVIKGIFLNRVSKSFYAVLKNIIEKECKTKVLGCIPLDERLSWKSRHLGLFLPDEIKNFKSQIDLASALLEETLDEPELLRIASSAAKLKKTKSLHSKKHSAQKKYGGLKIGVAYDSAFCFYYKKNISLLEEEGASIRYFSPLSDKQLPDVDGIILGGGYPELHAEALEQNESMKKAICTAVQNNMPVLAECGGFMYLQKEMGVQGGKKYKMCGAIDGSSFFTGKLVRFGYAEYTSNDSQFKIRGHEFHYFDSTNNGEGFAAKKASGTKSYQCIVRYKNVLAGFPHLYYNSCPEFLKSFLDKAQSYNALKKAKDE